MKLTLRGETIDIELGQEVTFYQYLIENDKVEFKEDKVVVDFIAEDFSRAAFRNEHHGATLHHYEMGNFYLSINDKNVLDFLTRKYRYYENQEKHLHNEIESLSKQIKELNNDRSKLAELIQDLYLRSGEEVNIKGESNLDINKSLYNIENRKQYVYDDDIAILFYKGYKVEKGTCETFRKNWFEEMSYSKDMNYFLANIGIELTIKLDDEDVKDNWIHIWDELDWNKESKSYKYKNWEWIVLDL